MKKDFSPDSFTKCISMKTFPSQIAQESPPNKKKCVPWNKGLTKATDPRIAKLHGPHPFDKNNPEDLAWLEVLKEKAKTSPQAKSYIYTWTDLDVRKLQTAIKNNLNFEAIYCKTHY